MRTEDIQNATDELWYMVNLKPSETGLTKVIWASPKMRSHGPRIKISTSATQATERDLYPITVEPNPRVVGDLPREISQSDVELARQWIKKNMEPLMAYWNDEITTTEFLSRLQKV